MAVKKSELYSSLWASYMDNYMHNWRTIRKELNDSILDCYVPQNIDSKN